MNDTGADALVIDASAALSLVRAEPSQGMVARCSTGGTAARPAKTARRHTRQLRWLTGTILVGLGAGVALERA